MGQPIRVLVVDDQRVVGEALALALAVESDLECVGVVTGVDDALELVVESQPDVVLMDLAMPGVDGIEGTRRVKHARPATAVLVLTGNASPVSLANAAEAGAAGFLQKDASYADILAAIRTPATGQMLVDPATLSALRRRNAQPAGHDAPSVLTPRELAVLELMGEGLDPRAIAERLHVSIHTTRGYVKSILSKLGVHSQLEAVVFAAKSGLLSGFGR
jgi:DNA-binding NarL/FixJ family response regulator